MILKHVLPRGTDYFPADIKPWDKDIIVCDIAKDMWPKPPVRVNTVAVLGVIEYVEDYQGFFHRLREYGADVMLSYQAVPFSHSGRELQSHDPSRHRLPGFPWERMHSLYLHELVEAAANAGFAVGWIQYRNVNAGVKACESNGKESFCFKEDEVLLKLLPISIPHGASDYKFKVSESYFHVDAKPDTTAIPAASVERSHGGDVPKGFTVYPEATGRKLGVSEAREGGEPLTLFAN